MTPSRFARQSEKRAPAKVMRCFCAIDEADAGFEAVVGLAAVLLLAEQALHPAMQPAQHRAWLVACGNAQHAVEQAPGDQGHERARHAMAGAVADHHRIALAIGWNQKKSPPTMSLGSQIRK